MTAKEYQASLLPLCRRRFPEQEIVNEWSAFTGLMHQYSPRVDIAVGPFNLGGGPNRMAEYDHLINTASIRTFINQAIEIHRQNIDKNLYTEIVHPRYNQLVSQNRNARCLIAMEIENTNSKKHMMGSIINAASLGRIGIGIAYCDSALRTFLRIVNYLAFLRRVGKNTYNTNNFLIVSVEQFNQLINRRI
jgi:hypothetical protein